jgi:hypothetical protein
MSRKMNYRQRFQKSIDDLAANIPKDNISILHTSDAYKVPESLNTDWTCLRLLPRGQWSHDFRPFPYIGGYLPVAKVAKALMTGFREGFSYKVFDSGANGKKRD